MWLFRVIKYNIILILYSIRFFKKNCNVYRNIILVLKCFEMFLYVYKKCNILKVFCVICNVLFFNVKLGMVVYINFK